MSNNEKKYFESTQSHYNRFSTGSEGSSRMESSGRFRDGFSAYHLPSGSITKGRNCVWSPKNTGGVPMDYDSANGFAFADGSDAHTLLIGATGSKKSRLVVMPAVRILGAAGESMIVCDPKAEIYRRTSGYLAEKNYDVRVINLRDPTKGDGWNILDIPFQRYTAGEIDKACEYINDQAATLIPTNSKDPYWDYSSRDLYVGLVLLLFELAMKFELSADQVNIQTLLRLKTDLFSSTNSRDIKRSPLWEFADKNELIRTKLLGIVICPSDTMGCILSVFDQYLSCFTLQPQIIKLLSKTTLEIDHIGYAKTAVFLIMPDEKSTYHKLITLFIKQIYELLIDQAYKEHCDNGFPLRVNFLLDEFSSLPTITDFPQMIAASRSRNIRFTIVVQSKHQMRQRYGDETETIQSNCANWMFLHSREVPLLQEISTLAGEKGNKPLIPVSRLQHLEKEKGECLVFAGRLYPYIAHLADISSYDNDNFCEYPMKDHVGEIKVAISFLDKLNQQKGKKADELFAQEKRELVGSLNPFAMDDSKGVVQLHDRIAELSDQDVNVDVLIEKINAKIAEIEAKEAVQKEGTKENDAHPVINEVSEDSQK